MNKILIDSNILLDIFLNDTKWADWSIDTLNFYEKEHLLCINSIIYSEISIGFKKIEELETALANSGLKLLPIPKEALFLAGKVFLTYKKVKGTKSSTLPDFFIGAHAAIEDIPLITRDLKRYQYYFPKLKIISPEEKFTLSSPIFKRHSAKKSSGFSSPL